ncbi:SpoIIE family protein phosphatase [Thalassobacillus sp. CUG 92003]|uniref:SpoIIE family protein phosphatase n=1 Tax=Thalassobacillus sp. CUG 92003 TaxID=2736641 RepID=UPI00351AAC5C
MSESAPQINVSVYQKPKKGNYFCGDSYFYKETDTTFTCALADGLGSGQLAMESSQAVMDTIEQNPKLDLEPLIKKCNDALSGKRGVVLGLLQVDLVNRTYSYSSIGNIGIIMVSDQGKKKRIIPLAGYLAGRPRKFRVIRGEIESGMMFLLFSDGVDDRQLSSERVSMRDVDLVTRRYDEMNEINHNDDTTLIAMQIV